MPTATRQPPPGVQLALDQIGTSLVDTTFVVVDLETTGGAPEHCGITEIGAVKVRGGRLLGEFATLVDPGAAIPAFITVLTGITDTMVAPAPRIESVLPAFLEFARGCVLVAHNAPFDTGFLKAVCRRHGHPWPAFTVVDTADLARRVLTRDDVADCRLATLARYFRSATTPCHRALADARATVDVLHGLIERLAAFGVATIEELRGFARAPTPQQQRKRHLAESVPAGPGVYMFIGPREEILYVGKSSDLRTRVRSYFTAAETRRRIREMVGIAERVVPIPCPTLIEAEVRELRLIAEHKPRYNRRSRHPERAVWIKLTVEPFPRLSLVRDVRADGAAYLGPYGSTRHAEQARDALLEAFPLRRCTPRMTPAGVAGGRFAACALAEIGRCGAPCDGRQSRADYAGHVARARAAMTGDARAVIDRMRRRIESCAQAQRYEDATRHRDRLVAYVRGATRTERLAALAGCAEMVAAQPRFDGAWDLVVLRYGRFAGSGVLPRGAHPVPFVDALVASAETVIPGPGPAPAASPEEMECALRWLSRPGLRLVRVDGTWSCPLHSAERDLRRLTEPPPTHPPD